MGKHQWPTTGDAPADALGSRWSTGSRRQDALQDVPQDAPEEDAADGPDAPGGPVASRPAGVQWRVARSAALVFLGIALAIGAALFLVRSSEPSAAAVSVELGADAPGGGEIESATGGAGTGRETGGDGDGVAEGPAAAPGSPDIRATALPGVDVTPDSPVVVYVTGAVGSPGVVEVPPGTRLFQIIEEAGGALPDADLEGINLAATVADGQHVHVLGVGEEPRPEVPDSAVLPSTVTPGGATDPTLPGSPGAAAAMIDINTATLAEIESLPRVGPVLGQRIIDWRDQNGPFLAPSDVDAVPGIGPALLEGILPLIVVR